MPSGKPVLAILAGGGSRRFGSDKALLRVGGLTLLEQLAELGRSAGLRVAVIGRIQPEPWRGPPATFLEDSLPGRGPLGGLAAALERFPVVLAVSCDLPRLDLSAIDWLLAAAALHPGSPGVAVRCEGVVQPLFAMWRARSRPAVQAALEAGKLALHKVVEEADLSIVTAPVWLGPLLRDVDTPEDWDRLRG